MRRGPTRPRPPRPQRVSGAARPAQGSSLTARSGSGCPGNPNHKGRAAPETPTATNQTCRRDCTTRNRLAT
ncbi:hypothetical protein C7C45_12640 [Micromonospora arborensis]|uniref:Uncharacterized protein n=1 Tax=Micromonospora arborensis TaxID=2116518 RepID=A0A318NWD0_9ACTN|nr:hypothetical protein C7C45_12640 [Micromonospora arborensis]